MDRSLYVVDSGPLVSGFCGHDGVSMRTKTGWRKGCKDGTDHESRVRFVFEQFKPLLAVLLHLGNDVLYWLIQRMVLFQSSQLASGLFGGHLLKDLG